jgi:hypothetical protein
MANIKYLVCILLLLVANVSAIESFGQAKEFDLHHKSGKLSAILCKLEAQVSA